MVELDIGYPWALRKLASDGPRIPAGRANLTSQADITSRATVSAEPDQQSMVDTAQPNTNTPFTARDREAVKEGLQDVAAGT